MERRQLEYFLAVASHGSFTGAAAELHVSQPSLSYAIGALERTLGVQVFHRLRRGVTLTPEGEALVVSAQVVMRSFAAAESSVRQVAHAESGQLDIVALTTLAVDPLAQMVGKFRQTYPGVDVCIADPVHAIDVVERVRSGECDLGLADFSVPLFGLKSLELARQNFVVIVGPDAELDTDRGPEGGLPVEQVATMDLIATPPGTTTRLLMDSALAAAGIGLHIAVETPHRAAIVPLVLAGAGVALVPESMGEAAARLGAQVVPTVPPVTRRIRLLWREPLPSLAAMFVAMARGEDVG